MGGDLMNFKDRIKLFHQYALTNSLSVYNEDSMTAQQLAIASANKVKECLLMVDELATAITNIKAFINYDETSEELALSIEQKIENLRKQVDSSYTCIYNEDAMSVLELAGQSAKMSNECVKTVNMLCDIVSNINDLIAMNYTDEMLVIGGEDNGN